MERDSWSPSNGGMSRMDRFDHMMLPQHSTQLHPRTQSMAANTSLESGNPLDLSSAIAHELQRSSGQQAWLAWQQRLVGGQQQAHQPSALPQSLVNGGNFLPQPYASGGGSGRLLPHSIPRFDDAMAGMGSSCGVFRGPASLSHMPMSLDYGVDTESFASEHDVFHSGSSGFPNDSDLQPTPQYESMGSLGLISPWIERMMQADVTPTPSPSLGTSSSPSWAQRAGTDISCVLSQTIELQSCHSSDVLRSSERSARSALHEPTVEADLCTDDDDLETAPVDEKRKKRMLSNRASAQRSRQRRQERLDQLEVLTAQLRVENSALINKANLSAQVARKFEEENKQLLKRIEKLTQELEGRRKTKVGSPLCGAAADECTSSQQTTCASSDGMVGGRMSGDMSARHGATPVNRPSAPSVLEGSRGRPPGIGVAAIERGVDILTRHNEWAPSPSGVTSRSAPATLSGKKRPYSQSPASIERSHSSSWGSHMGYGSGNGHLSQAGPLPRPLTPAAARLVAGPTPVPIPPCFSLEVCDSLELDLVAREKNRLDWLEEERWLNSFADY